MRVIGPEAGRLIVPYSAEEVRPESGFDMAEFVRSAGERYGFVVRPNLAELKGDYSAIEFKTGAISKGDSKISITKLAVTYGGLAIDATATEDAEIFYEDIFEWASAAFGLRKPQTETIRYYLSNVIVEFDTAFETAIPAFQKMLTIINPALQEYAHVRVDANLQRLSFNCDPKELLAITVRTDFVIERRAGSPYRLNRYFCSGPFPTRTLIAKLEEIERSLTS